MVSKVNSIIEGLRVSRTGTIIEGTDISEDKKVMKASDKDLKSGYIRESGIVGNNVRLVLKDARGNSCSISNLIEIGNKYNFGEKEFKNVISDCKRSPKDIAKALNNEKDWLVANFESIGNEKGSDSGCTIKVVDSLKNKYYLYIKY